MSHHKAGLVIAAALTLFSGAACAGGTEASESGDDSSEQTLTIGYINWDEDVAVTHLWERILTEKGYEVETTLIADAGPAFVGLANGDYDLFMDGSLPDIHASYWEEYGDELTDLGPWYDGVTQAIAIPDHMDEKVRSLEDLPLLAEELDKTIVGIEPGAGLMRSANRALEDYGLEEQGWRVAEASTPAMLTALQSASQDKTSVAVTLWHPHWAYSSFEVRDLEDPKGSMGDPGRIHSLGSPTFRQDFPEVADMMEKFELTDQQLGSLEQAVILEHEGAPQEGAEAWLKSNPKFLESID